MEFDKKIWWARDAANILFQNGSASHAEAVIGACERLAYLEGMKAAFDIRSRWVTEMQQLAHSEGWCRNVTGESMVDFFYRRIDELKGESAGFRKVLEPFVRFYSQFKAVHTNVGSGFVLTPDHIKAAKDAFDNTPDRTREIADE